MTKRYSSVPILERHRIDSCLPKDLSTIFPATRAALYLLRLETKWLVRTSPSGRSQLLFRLLKQKMQKAAASHVTK